MDTVIPRSNDALFGRGTSINVHPGNRRFRSLVETYRPAFLEAKNSAQKRAVAEQLFNEIQCRQCRFLEEADPRGQRMEAAQQQQQAQEDIGNISSFNAVHPSILTKTWLVVEPKKALHKILKRLREKDKSVVVAHPGLPNIVQSHNTTNEECSPFQDPQMLPSSQSQQQLLEHKVNDAYPVAEVTYSHDRLVSNHPLTTSTQYSFPGENVDEAQESTYARRLNLWTASVDDFRSQYHTITSDIDIKPLPALATDKCMEQQTAERDGLSWNYLEGSGVTFDTDTFWQGSAQQPSIDASEQLCEYTLQQWVMHSKPDIRLHTSTSAQSHEHVVNHFIKSALLIALKLTECMLEAEQDEAIGHGNPIPLASIAAENVLIRTRKHHHRAILGESDDEDAHENIEFVWVMSIVGDESASGTVMSRLFAVGKVLYKLFTSKDPFMECDDLHSFPMASTDSISLRNQGANDCHTQLWHSGQAGDQNSKYVADLESNGVPLPLSDLIVNLLECRHDPFCDDDVYASFAHLQVDLQLMLENPSFCIMP